MKARLCYTPRLCSTDPWDNRLPQDDENGKKMLADRHYYRQDYAAALEMYKELLEGRTCRASVALKRDLTECIGEFLSTSRFFNLKLGGRKRKLTKTCDPQLAAAWHLVTSKALGITHSTSTPPPPTILTIAVSGSPCLLMSVGPGLQMWTPLSTTSGSTLPCWPAWWSCSQRCQDSGAGWRSTTAERRRRG